MGALAATWEDVVAADTLVVVDAPLAVLPEAVVAG